jgi:hypothetical protein
MLPVSTAASASFTLSFKAWFSFYIVWTFLLDCTLWSLAYFHIRRSHDVILYKIEGSIKEIISAFYPMILVSASFMRVGEDVLV